MISESFNKSFSKEFCTRLEYTLCSVFTSSEDAELNIFWCDSVSWAPYYDSEVNRDYLLFEKVNDRGYIETSVLPRPKWSRQISNDY